MEIRIIETGELKSIIMTDPKTGCDWFHDCGAMDCNDITWNKETEEYEASQEGYDWWKKYADERVAADNAVFEMRKTLSNEDQESFDTQVLDAQCQCNDMEDMPRAALRVVAEWEDLNNA